MWSTRKENNRKTEETLVRAVVTLETERIKGSNPWCLWWWWWWWLYAVNLSPFRTRDPTEYIITPSGLANYYKSLGHWAYVMEETWVGATIQRNYSLQIKSFINYMVCVYIFVHTFFHSIKKYMAKITRNFRHCAMMYDVGAKLHLIYYASCGTFAFSNVSWSSALCCLRRKIMSRYF
jgi:hypothetical protein